MMNYFKTSSPAAISGQSNYTNFSESLPYFILNQSLQVLISPDIRYFSKTFYLSRICWAQFFLLSRLSIPSTLPIIVDGAQFTLNNSKFVIQFNLSSMLSDDRTSVYTNVSADNFSLFSISTIFTSCVWLERELSDFTNINFLGLVDTRRLLLDYFEVKAS